MTRQLEQVQEERIARKHGLLIRAIEFGLQGAIGTTGGELTGFSVKLNEWECLMTLRATRDGVPHVAFVVSDCMVDCILKAVRDAGRDKLRWREDKYIKTS